MNHCALNLQVLNLPKWNELTDIYGAAPVVGNAVVSTFGVEPFDITASSSIRRWVMLVTFYVY